MTHLQRLWISVSLALAVPTALLVGQSIPKVWRDADLRDWATPLAGLNQRPSHVSAEEYYAAPLDDLRTYPVYYPGREPDGYWEMLQKVGPKRIIEPEALRTEKDWIQAGRIVFEQYDLVSHRSLDPDIIRTIRSKQENDAAGSHADQNGIFPDLRWVPTARGVAIGVSNCAACHTRLHENGTLIIGAPANGLRGGCRVAGPLFLREHVAGSPVRLQEPLPMRWYRASAVPWVAGDVHEELPSMPLARFFERFPEAGNPFDGVFSRWNGSPLYVTKIPDLIGIRDRKYLDHTATHRHRGIGDLMRYAALVSSAESVSFGPHRMLPSGSSEVEPRLSDEALYALALFIYSLQPPPNPNAFDQRAKAGKRVFQREGCGKCHTPPLYTNNKLTLAEGFRPASSNPDVLPLSVGTDPGLALKTRKGTGFYKVPSLKGVWYRGHYLHDGSVGSLEELLNPERLQSNHVPGGWRAKRPQAIPGHEFGLHLSSGERANLIAFLRTL